MLNLRGVNARCGDHHSRRAERGGLLPVPSSPEPQCPVCGVEEIRIRYYLDSGEMGVVATNSLLDLGLDSRRCRCLLAIQMTDHDSSPRPPEIDINTAFVAVRCLQCRPLFVECAQIIQALADGPVNTIGNYVVISVIFDDPFPGSFKLNNLKAA